jgi:hypothetical protein
MHLYGICFNIINTNKNKKIYQIQANKINSILIGAWFLSQSAPQKNSRFMSYRVSCWFYCNYRPFPCLVTRRQMRG